MPNLGMTGEDDLLGITKGNAAGGIYTTFIGIGVDFNTELVEHIIKIRGANYYSVHSDGQFRERMDDEFEYMVTPLLFDLRLMLDARGWEIEKVYGSPEANESTGELMRVNTLFPSSRKEGETRGGLILLKMRKTAPDNTLNLVVTYEDRNGRSDTAITTVKLQYISPEYFGNNGIRKGILLARYADLLKNWIIDEHEQAHLSRSLLIGSMALSCRHLTNPI
jgi:Ca-activated chloride channel family protein